MIFNIITSIIILFRLPLLYKWKSIHKRSIYINRWESITKNKYNFTPEKDLPITIGAFIMGATILWSVVGLMYDNLVFLLILFISSSVSILQNILDRLFENYVKSNYKLILTWLLLLTNTLLLIYSIL